MKVTNVSVRKLENQESKCKAVATVVLEDCLAIHNIRIIEGKDKLFISMPSKKVEDKYYDYIHPTVNSLRQELERAILEEYNK